MLVFPCAVDRRTCDFLSTFDFLSFRKTCKKHYEDSKAWHIRSLTLPINCPKLNYREKIGLHYMLGWSLHFGIINSEKWWRSLVYWPRSKSGIKIVHIFLNQFNHASLQKLDLSKFDSRRRFIWLRRLGHGYPVFKRTVDFYQGHHARQSWQSYDSYDERGGSYYCEGKVYRNTQQCYG